MGRRIGAMMISPPLPSTLHSDLCAILPAGAGYNRPGGCKDLLRVFPVSGLSLFAAPLRMSITASGGTACPEISADLR